MKTISTLTFAGIFVIGGIGPTEVVTGSVLLKTITAAAVGMLAGSAFDYLSHRFDQVHEKWRREQDSNL